jgi:hypothetical protein
LWAEQPQDDNPSAPSLLSRVCNVARIAATDRERHYVVTPLDSGVYPVTARVTGFQTTVRENVELTVGQAARVELVLAISALSDGRSLLGGYPAEGWNQGHDGSPVAGGTNRFVKRARARSSGVSRVERRAPDLLALLFCIRRLS